MRFNYRDANPQAFQALIRMEQYASSTDIDPALKELIKIRVSQLNGCAFCINMHTKDARKHGETEQRLYLLNAWRETSLYTAEERAALALAEAVTRIGDAGVTDDLYESVRAHFNEKQFVDLIFVINTINSWNRMGISSGMEPGDYE
ncbi:carboxymuconolactone decarboxylase family protein [Paenibacillus mendelii]|uniref:Carboxymuconolactone decarboxylase family protein n=1 Tax=Paenibacillus mendelii TaxID=206163 RepID=A0ABV6JGS9_9BACL|nr:carboxymuconolactone decarboxylase family protein [Paenibacillus mendelii]MCQ6557796.1 carboxymuconolactone decarboxylase family protein [Paenibacillus mendelii]